MKLPQCSPHKRPKTSPPRLLFGQIWDAVEFLERSTECLITTCSSAPDGSFAPPARFAPHHIQDRRRGAARKRGLCPGHGAAGRVAGVGGRSGGSSGGGLCGSGAPAIQRGRAALVRCTGERAAGRLLGAAADRACVRNLRRPALGAGTATQACSNSGY